jgi:glutathione synthase/RimK-type ligase-like ATP-grasp enzyme
MTTRLRSQRPPACPAPARPTRRIAFLSCQDMLDLPVCPGEPLLAEDDGILAHRLRAAGYEVRAVAWDDPTVFAEDWDALLFRSTWNYVAELPRFHRFLDRLEGARGAVLNPPAVVRWNLNKTYLLDLAAAGVPIVPTRLIRPDASPSLRAVAAAAGWRELVLKPAISVGAQQTYRFGVEECDAHEDRLRAILRTGPALLQPMVPEVQTRGEWSLVFFGGRYSHAVLKRPAPGDFRVQFFHGGSESFEPAAPGLVAQARRVVRAVPRLLRQAAPPLFARVDGVVVGGVLRLMELELIEPCLFFRADPAAASRCLAALRGQLPARRPTPPVR